MATRETNTGLSWVRVAVEVKKDHGLFSRSRQVFPPLLMFKALHWVLSHAHHQKSSKQMHMHIIDAVTVLQLGVTCSYQSVTRPQLALRREST